MCKKLTLLRTISTIILLFLFTVITKSYAQTTLTQGDISIIGFSTDGTLGRRQVAFVTWVPLSNQTVIKFSDNGFLSSGNSKSAKVTYR